MNCKTCRMELSQYLDGRLPSGRRALVMGHLSDCAACSDFWGEMERAQELALSAPPARVSSSFHDGLWDRIRSGEGTPEAVFREPVPLASKVRYAVAGAAAAAAVLLIANGVLFGAGAPPVDPQPDEVRIAEPDRPSAPDIFIRPVQFSPNNLADVAAQTIADDVSMLERDYRLANRTDLRLDQLQVRRQALVESLDRLRCMGRILLMLREGEFVDMPRVQEFQLREIVAEGSAIERLREARAPEELVVRLGRVLIKTRELQRLPTRVVTTRLHYSDLELRDFAYKFATDWSSTYPEIRQIKLLSSPDEGNNLFASPAPGPRFQGRIEVQFIRGFRTPVPTQNHQVFLIHRGSAPEGILKIEIKAEKSTGR